MARNVSFFVLVILLTSLGMRVQGKERKLPEYLKYVDEVTEIFLDEVSREYGFECGSSGGSMPYDVEEISVKLVAEQSATVEAARELLVKTTERFAQIINAHEKIRPFLREYPFPASRADVSISFRNPKKKKFSLSNNNDNVVFAFQAKGKIFYHGHNPENEYLFRPIKDEPYEEAVKIVQKDASKNPSPRINI